MDRKTNLIDIVKFGIDRIGTNTSVADIRSIFNTDYTNYGYDFDPVTNLMLFHKYLGQEHLSLFCDQDSYCLILDFDLLPIKNKLIDDPNNKYLVNFKVKMSSKKHSLFKFLKAPLEAKYREVKTFLNEGYPKDKILNRTDLITKEDMDTIDTQINTAYDGFIPKPEEILINYITKNNTLYLAVFYHSKGNKATLPFLSFSVSDPTV